MVEPRIRVLSSEVVNQIAAGEVIERPASAVKELVENSLDAGARRIDVEVEEGGLRSIRVVDDGCGMTAEELRLCLERHATSKLRGVDDLWRIRTMGFRGEALPSIAAVGRLHLRSRAQGSEAGQSLRLEGEKLLGEEPAGCPPGTLVEVRDLFFNTPARLKFLKSRATETAHISESVTRLALGVPGVHLTLSVEGRRTLDLPACGGRLERARAALGRRGVELSPASLEEPGLRVEACLAPPLAAGRTAQSVSLVVNGRFVRDRSLAHAVAAGYGEQLAGGRYPVAVIYLDVDPERVDVNVHPQKLEVRLAEPDRVYAALRRCVRDGLARAAPATAGEAARYHLASAGAGYQEQKDRLLEATRRFWSAQDASRAGEAPAIYPEGGEATGYYSGLRVIGQALSTYLVCEDERAGELVLIDQHAAHERVSYERLRLAGGGSKVASQRLLIPVPVSLEPRLDACAREHTAALQELGFDLEPFGGGTFALRGLPEVLRAADPARLLVDVLEDLSSYGGSERVAGSRDELLARMACHASVRAGRPLEAHEIRALLASLDQIDFSQTCPHGRPVAVRLERSELERRFGRA